MQDENQNINVNADTDTTTNEIPTPKKSENHFLYRLGNTVLGFGMKDWAEVLFFAAVSMCGIIARSALFSHLSSDMRGYLIPWYEYLRDNGGFAAVGDDIGDYTPAYYYFLAFLTYTKIPVVEGIKVFSAVFEFIGAVYIKRIVEIRYRRTTRPMIAFAAAFCLPTAILNSAAWGQCDGIYTCFIIMSLYYLLKGRDIPSMGWFGAALAVKLQAVFFAPFVAVMFMKRKLRFRSLLMVPGVYVASLIPAVIAGGDFFRLLTVYIRQSGQYAMLNMALPNMWSLLFQVEPGNIGTAGVYVAGAGVLIFMYYCTFCGGIEKPVTVNSAIAMAAVSCFAVPYLLPYMHERYYFTSDMLIILIVMYFPKRMWLLPATQFCSVIAVAGNVFGKERLDMRLVALLETFALVYVFLSLRDEMQSPANPELKMKHAKKPAEASQKM